MVRLTIILGANDILYLRIPHTTLVCYPRVRHGYSVYRWRRDRICPHAFHPIHRCRIWVRLPWYLRQTTLTLRPLRHRACSVGALYLYSGDSIRKHTANGLETALGEYLLVFKPLEMLNPK
jgi:hypothetical protein